MSFGAAGAIVPLRFPLLGSKLCLARYIVYIGWVEYHYRYSPVGRYFTTRLTGVISGRLSMPEMQHFAVIPARRFRLGEEEGEIIPCGVLARRLFIEFDHRV